MEKIVFKLHHKMEELSSQMKPADYAQIQIWERLIGKINEIVDSMNEQTEELKHLQVNLIDLQKEVLKGS